MVLALTWNNRSSAIALHILNSTIQTIIFIFVNTLFITSYPASWLIYFFIGQTIIDFMLSYVLTPVLAKNSRVYPSLVLISMAVVTGIFCALSFYHFYYVPMAFSLFLIAAGVLINVMSWNTARIAFDVIEFKELSAAIAIYRSASDVLVSICVFLLLTKLKTIVFLPYIIIVTFMLASIFSYQLKPLLGLDKKARKQLQPFKYKLYQHIFVTVILVAVIYTLVDYCLKFQLSVGLIHPDIGPFMAAFNAVACILSFILSLAGIKFIINHFGVSFLLMTLPVYWLVTAFGVALFPGLNTVAVMAAGKYIFYLSLFASGRELVFNVLPSSIRISGQVFVKSMASPLGTAIASLFLFMFARHTSVAFIAGMVILICLLLLWYDRKMHATYVSTLKEAINLQRFDAAGEMSHESLEILKTIVTQSLVSKDPETISLGFSLLPQLNLEALPPKVLRLLNSAYPDIRIQAIQMIASFHTTRALRHLLKRLAKEKDPEVKWWLLDTAAGLDPGKVLEVGRKFLHDPAPEIASGAIRILLASDHAADQTQALVALRQMLTNPAVAMRKNAARVLRYINTDEARAELCKLIADSDDNVSSCAMESAAQLKEAGLAAVVIQRVLKGGVFFAARKSLLQFKDEAVPALMRQIVALDDYQVTKLKLLIALLGSIPGEEAERQFIKLVQYKSNILRYIAIKELAYRTRKEPLLKENRMVIKEAIYTEFHLISALNVMRARFAQPVIANEFAAKLFFAKQRLLYLLTIYSNAHDVFSLVSIILKYERIEQAKALELLISIIHQDELTQIILNVYLNKPISLPDHFHESPEYCLDDWLKEVISAGTQSEKTIMNTMQKVFILRRVALFKQLPGEILLSIAEQTTVVDTSAGETIFMEGDAPTGLYIIATGEVEIIKHAKLLTTLKEYDFFGELALLDNVVRTTSAIAKTDGTLIYIEKETFDRITEDLPEVLRAVVQVILRYLRVNLDEKK